MIKLMSATIAQFENVGLRYGTGAETLSDVSFSLDGGGFYFLTGPSGPGKTSLLKLLYLALRPSRGLIRLFDEDVVTLPRDRLPGFRRRIGVVFQDFRLVPHLSAFDNLALPLRVAGVDGEELATPVNEMLAWVGLSDRANAQPATLSGGEQQRVAIARAVIGCPEILIADESTGNVDPEMAARLLHLFDVLHKLGTTLVVATHDIHLLSRVSSALFQRRIALDVLLGGIIGFLCAIIALLLLGQRIGAVGSELLSSARLPLSGWLLLALLPIGGAIVSTLVARFTVIGELKKML